MLRRSAGPFMSPEFCTTWATIRSSSDTKEAQNWNAMPLTW